MRIETSRLIIRNIHTSDIDELLGIYTDKNNMKYISTGKFDWTRKELREKYEKLNVNNDKGFGVFSVELKETKQIIGEAGYFDSFNDNSNLELGYIIDNKFWKQGYGTEICKALIEYGFQELNLKRLTARMYANNKASVHLSEKLGMKMVSKGFTENKEEYCEYVIDKKEVTRNS